VGFPLAVADLEDGHGEFLPRPVGAVALPVEDRGELSGGMDAIEDLGVLLPRQQDYPIPKTSHQIVFLPPTGYPSITAWKRIAECRLDYPIQKTFHQFVFLLPTGYPSITAWKRIAECIVKYVKKIF
jgi:hypothetical protein